MDKNLQNSLIESIQILVDEAIKNTAYTSSFIGRVTNISGLEATVEIYGVEQTCKLMEHLQNSVSIGDIVVVQDLYNDKTKKFVQSKIGSTK